MSRVSLTRRINLGNYQHYEIFVEIDDHDENSALKRCYSLTNKALSCLGADQIDLTKLGK